MEHTLPAALEVRIEAAQHDLKVGVAVENNSQHLPLDATVKAPEHTFIWHDARRHSELKWLFEAGARWPAWRALWISIERRCGSGCAKTRRFLGRHAEPRRRPSTRCRDHLEARWQTSCGNAAELARLPIRAEADIRPWMVLDWATKRRRASINAAEATPDSRSAPRWRPSIH